jgi:hypothetical protein
MRNGGKRFIVYGTIEINMRLATTYSPIFKHMYARRDIALIELSVAASFGLNTSFNITDANGPASYARAVFGQRYFQQARGLQNISNITILASSQPLG